LRSLNFHNLQEASVAVLPKPTALAISPDHRRLIYSQIDRQGY